MEGEQYFTFLDNVITELLRVTRHYIFFNIQLLSSNKLAILKILGKRRYDIKDLIIWNKDMAPPAAQPGTLNTKFELVISFSKDAPLNRSFSRHFFSQGSLFNVISGKSNSGNSCSELHSAAYPEYFVRFFIDNFSKEGDIVLDPFSGTGTTLYCAKQMKRKFIGFEIVPEYIKVINDRLSQNSLSDLFN
jgi:DNA modification methylase